MYHNPATQGAVGDIYSSKQQAQALGLRTLPSPSPLVQTLSPRALKQQGGPQPAPGPPGRPSGAPTAEGLDMWWVSVILANTSSLLGRGDGRAPTGGRTWGHGRGEEREDGERTARLKSDGHGLEPRRCAPKSEKRQLCLPALCHDPAP